jgi:uncharacterized protein YndB with AHSA1/START domain
MTERSVLHPALFAAGRRCPRPPARVLAAFATPRHRVRWSAGGDGPVAEHGLEFSVGGREPRVA